jgi:hypothetical protein
LLVFLFSATLGIIDWEGRKAIWDFHVCRRIKLAVAHDLMGLKNYYLESLKMCIMVTIMNKKKKKKIRWDSSTVFLVQKDVDFRLIPDPKLKIYT